MFEGAERLARRTQKSRSRLFTDAVREYVARHAPEEVTAATDRFCADVGIRKAGGRDAFVTAAAQRVLERNEW